jgi:predicted DNA-binding transcriptional regulator AlpA
MDRRIEQANGISDSAGAISEATGAPPARADLVPLKRVLDKIGASRTTLWRALNSDVEGLPKPTIVGRRLYWTPSQIAALGSCLRVFQGRSAFERRRDRDRALEAHENLVRLKARVQRRRRAGRGQAQMQDQTDLFGR